MGCCFSKTPECYVRKGPRVRPSAYQPPPVHYRRSSESSYESPLAEGLRWFNANPPDVEAHVDHWVGGVRAHACRAHPGWRAEPNICPPFSEGHHVRKISKFKKRRPRTEYRS